MKSYKIGKIISNDKISEGIYKMEIACKMKAKPGQFLMVRNESFRNSPLLSRPFGICDISDKSITILYQVKGIGTKILSNLKENNNIQVLGPLGKGFNLKSNKKSAILSGGIGIAPMLYLAKSLDNKADFYAGFGEDEYFIDEFKDYTSKIFTTSEKKDGKFITDLINTNDYEVIYACGPNPMLQALTRKNKNTEIQISMEAHMACGIGACLGCTIENIRGDFIRVCKDGPVFDAKEICG